jgi:hypothetical protein
LFEGQAYLHRKSNLSDLVAMHLYEDLHVLGRSMKLVQRVDSQRSVLNTMNQRRGIKARRGDGSFVEVVPNADPIRDSGFWSCPHFTGHSGGCGLSCDELAGRAHFQP